MKKWYKSKTVWTNVVLATVFTIQQLSPELGEILSERVLFIITVLSNGILRLITTDAIDRYKGAA